MIQSAGARKRVATLLVALMMLPTSAVFAETRTAADYYRQASDAYGAGEFQQAADLLERAFALEHNLVYKYNQILALQGLGDHREALRVLDIYEAPMIADGRFDDLAEIRQQLEAAVNGDAPQDAVAEGTEPVEVGDDVIALPDPGPVPTASEGPNYVAWSLVGVGGASLITGALFGSGVFLADEKEQMRDNPPHAPVYKAAHATYERHQTLTWVFLGTGLALGGAGAALLLLDTRGSGDGAEAGAGATLELVPHLDPGAAGATLQLRF